MGCQKKQPIQKDKLAAWDFNRLKMQCNKVYFWAALYILHILHTGKGAHSSTALQIVDDHLKHIEDQEDDNR